MTFRTARFILLLAAAWTAPIDAQSANGADSIRVERLAGLGRVWGYAKYFHPALAYRSDIDWDAALVAAIPLVRQSRTAAEYRAAVQSMLDVLEDPLTHVVSEPDAASADNALPARELDYQSTPENILVVTVGNYYSLSSPLAQRKLQELAGAIPKARAVVFDLRSRSATDGFARAQVAGTLAEIQRLLIGDTLATPGDWRRVYYGYESPSPFSSGQYRTGVTVFNGSLVLPTRSQRDIPSIFVVNRHSALLPVSTALQVAGSALVVFEGDLRTHTIGEFTPVTLADGLMATVRQSESVLADGTSAVFQPDAIVPDVATRTSDPPLLRALGMARDFERSRVRRRRLPSSIAPPRERSYPQMRAPTIEYRLLAAFRIWSAIEYFFPYKQLLDHDWNGVLAEVIPAFEGAADAREYTLAVVTLASKIQDSHAYVGGMVFNDDIVGAGYPPVRVRVVQGTPVVTALFDTAAALAAGLQVGDIVVSVDGKPAAARLTEIGSYYSVSTPQSRMDKATLSFMNGPVGSKVTLTVRDRANREKQVMLERRREDFNTLYHRERRGDVVRMLPGNVGYVDLDRLPFDGVESMFERLKETKAIVFDMRGYPNGTYWRIAPYLTDSVRVVARFETPMAGHHPQAPAAESFVQTVEPVANRELRYRGRTVMLIDERSVSQAEHMGLFLRGAGGTRFVGTPTAGANGEITTITIPGGISVGFTGQGVTWPDGRQLQRTGLRPDIVAKPTIAGIRAGRDEVLETALRSLSGRR